MATTTAGPPSVAGAGDSAGEGARAGFTVHLDVFDGPFELLLGLVTARRLDITEVSLAQVTDDFLAHLARRRGAAGGAAAGGGGAGGGGAGGGGWDPGEASAFLVVAATLLDLKVAALLPRDERAEDPEELLRLEARDLLFARLLQYRAFAAAAARLGEALRAESAHVPRAAGAEHEPGGVLHRPLPELDLSTTPAELAALAAAVVAAQARAGGALQRRPPPAVDLTHLHAPRASVPEQVALLAERLRAAGGAQRFDALVADAGEVAVVVGRFLALLQMFSTGAVDLEQERPMAALTVRWVRP